MPAPLLIALPDGLNVSGVAAWATRLASGLARRGRGAALLLHPEPPDQSPVDYGIDPRVRILRPPSLPRLDTPGARLTPAIGAYRDAARSLACDFGGPVVLSPNNHGDCYGAAAALALADPELVRIVGWQHSDNEYDARVLARYEPVIAKFAPVSDRIEAKLRAALPSRSADIANTPCGVEISDTPKPAPSPGAPLRLIYTGRIEHRHKRALALIDLSDALSARAISHTLTVAGDGPQAAELAAAVGSRPIRLLGAVAPARVPALLHEHDLFVLPSRLEGLSVAMLEAMGAGCVPVVARTESGCLQVIERGYNGEIADIGPEADERATGIALADAVARALKRGLAPMSEAARQTVRERFSLGRHLDLAASLIDAAAAAPARAWPPDRPCAFTASSAAFASGSVPPDGPERMRAILTTLAGRTIVIHGVGEHTRQLGPIFAASPARIVAFTDDDRARHGQRIWNWPVISPTQAAVTGATDVIISSWLHESSIWHRREAYERQGLRVWPVYVPADSAISPLPLVSEQDRRVGQAALGTVPGGR